MLPSVDWASERALDGREVLLRQAGRTWRSGSYIEKYICLFGERTFIVRQAKTGSVRQGSQPILDPVAVGQPS
jgi:hypothetical protein